MIRRREMLLAGLGVGALTLSEALRPRTRLVLLRRGTISEAIPREFGDWMSEDSSLVSPAQAGRLAKTLYSETVGRTYYKPSDGAAVMVLAAYGDTQSDLLQLHRPESCYPAVGYALRLSQPADVQIGPNAVLPARRVVAEMEGRTENIIYWTRLGERMPQSGGDQRTARLQNSIEGYVADGILLRCSVLGGSAEAFRLLDTFIPSLLKAVKSDVRPALIGTRLAQQVV